MVKFNNPTRLHPFVAAMLAYNDYDYIADPNVISVTSLMKPVNMVALERFHSGCDKEVDVEALVPSVMGSAMHSLLEVALESTQPDVWEQFNIQANKLEILQEQRVVKQIPGTKYKLAGKFDVLYKYDSDVWRLGDLKTLSTMALIMSGPEKMEEFTKQLSQYRWLNQDKSIEDIADIYYWYTDWAKVRALQDSSYPQSRVGSFEVALWSLDQTEGYIKTRVLEIDKAMTSLTTTGDTGVRCSDTELWRSTPKFKYYKPNKSGTINYKRATKVFDTLEDAQTYMVTAGGGVGDIKEFPAEIKRCKYCSVTNFCSQYKEFVEQGLIV
jgi:hypothetical protein